VVNLGKSASYSSCGIVLSKPRNKIEIKLWKFLFFWGGGTGSVVVVF